MMKAPKTNNSVGPSAESSGRSFAWSAHDSAHDDMLDIADVLGKQAIKTRLHKKITIREESAIAALEVISRFAVNSKWLIYLPPTMSPVAASPLLGLREHPAEAFGYYRQQGVSTVVCEEKHTGSRFVIIICRDEAAVQKRFGINDEGIGICYTRTGQRFFTDQALETAFIDSVRQALDATNFWTAFSTDWVCLDCELMPLSARPQGLLKQKYAPTGAAATQALNATTLALEKTAARLPQSVDVLDLLTRQRQRAALADQYVETYRRYCWPVGAVDDLKLAPFHILATEGKAYVDRSHEWHMQQTAKIAQADPALMQQTRHRLVDVDNRASCTEGIRWWERLAAAGGEGMIIKPINYIHRGRQGFAQPALKCRTPEFLSMVYGPEHSPEKEMHQLKNKGLNRKRSLAIREFSLGVESLERFVSKAPLRAVHECIFGILALEGEPVDPRLDRNPDDNS